MTTKEPSRLTKALLETADDMRRAGVMDAATHAKITLRHLGNKAHLLNEPISGPEIRKLILARQPTQALHQKAVDEGMIEVRKSALIKVAQGQTSIEEVFRTIPQKLSEAAAASLQAVAGVPFGQIPFSILPPLSSPCGRTHKIREPLRAGRSR